MDQPTGNPLSAIDRILAEMVEVEKQPDEFTAKDLVERLGMSQGAIGKRLNTKVEKGILTCRFIRIDGAKTKVYKYA